MKIGMHHLHLFILLFAASSLLFHSPSEVFAAEGDITAVRAQSLGNHLEHEDGINAVGNSLVQVDSDTYALAYQGPDSDGWIKTFTISADGSTITEVDNLEHDTDFAWDNSLIKIDSDTFALAYGGADVGTSRAAGFISTFTIDSDGNITPIRIQNHSSFASASANLNHDTNEGSVNSLVHVNDDTYALSYERNGLQLRITTFTISSDGATITELDTLNHDATNCNDRQLQSLVKVDSDTVARAYCGSGGDGYLRTYSIAENGDITKKSTYEFDTEQGTEHSLVQVDSDTIALAYQGTSDRNGYIKTFTIGSGDTISQVDSYVHVSTGSSGISALYNSLVNVDSDIYALAYSNKQGLYYPGYISTFKIDSDGDISALRTQDGGDNLLHDNTTNSSVRDSSLVKVDSDTIALAYKGADGDGYIATFTIDSTYPTVTITSSTGDSGDAVSDTTLSYTATFSESTSNFVVGDITVTGTANDGSPEASNFDGSGTTYTFDVVQGSSDGTVSVSVAAGTATDAAGNDNTVSSTYTFTIDTVGPTVTITSSNGDSGSSISATTLSYTATFSESVTGFTIGDITVSGSANAQASNFAGSGSTYTFDVVKNTSNGDVDVKIGSGIATGSDGNTNVISNTYSFSPVTFTSDASASTGTCSRHVILGNCGTIAINNDEYRIINTWTNVPTTEVLVGQPVTVTLSTPNNPTHTKIHFASVHTEVFSIPANFDQTAHIDYSIMSDSYSVTKAKLFQVAAATHRIVQDPDVKNLELFEVVFTMIFAKPMDTSHVVVETENKHGIPETLYLLDALKVNENLAQALTLEEKSKFSIIDPEPEMDTELEMDPEPEQTKKEKSKRQRR